MAEIVPSIIAQNFEELKKKIVQVEGLVNWVQLDVADGCFALPVSWSAPDDLENIDGRTKIEAHLMVKEPEEYLLEWKKYVDRILVHEEATDHLAEIAEAFNGSIVEFGAVLNMETPIEKLEDLGDKLKVIQLMSIDKLGHYGAEFDEKIYDKLEALRERYPNVTINVDGGVNLDNAKKLVDAGANNLVVGSAIWSAPDIPIAIKKFQDVLE